MWLKRWWVKMSWHRDMLSHMSWHFRWLNDPRLNGHISVKYWDIRGLFSAGLLAKIRATSMQNLRPVPPKMKKLWRRKVPRVIRRLAILTTRNRLTPSNFGKRRPRMLKFCRLTHKSPKTCSVKFGADRMYSLWVMVRQSCTIVFVLFTIGQYRGVTWLRHT